MLNKELPFLRTGIPLCLGIISGLYIKPGIIFLSFSLAFLITGFLLSLFYNKKPVNKIYGYSLSLSLFLCGNLLYRVEKKSLSDLDHVSSIFHCSVADYPEENENSYRIILKLHSRIQECGGQPLRGSLLVYFRKEPGITSLLPGDLLSIRLTPNQIVNRGNPNEFDYRFYMENHGIKYYCFADVNDILSHSAPERRNFKHRALIIREKLIAMYRERGVTSNNLPLVAAITLGERSMLEAHQKEIFIKAGIMHIMAVSGLHAGILSLFVFNILFFMRRKFRILRTMITIMFLWFFAFVTGLTPSVMRATLMFSFLHTGKLMKRNINNLNSVLASAFILILIRPSVIFDAGFLLSYSAVISIICFVQDFYNKLNGRTWIVDKIWKSAAVTIVAQAGTLALTISLFNRFPVWFILTNVIIVPVSSALIISGCLILLTYPIKFISQPLAVFLNQLTWLTEKLTEKASELPLSTIENIGMGNIESFLFYIVIFIILLFFANRKEFPLLYPLFALLIFISVCTVRSISDKTSCELIVYNGITSSPVGIRTGRILNLYSETDTILPDISRHCATRWLKIKPMKMDSHIQMLQAGNKRILISNNLTDNVLQKTMPDIIILKGNYPRIDKRIDLTDKVEAIICTSDVSSGFKLNIKSDKNRPDTIHYVRHYGAFRTKL